MWYLMKPVATTTTCSMVMATIVGGSSDSVVKIFVLVSCNQAVNNPDMEASIRNAEFQNNWGNLGNGGAISFRV